MDIVMAKKQSVLAKLFINTFLLGVTGIKSVTFTVIILYNKYRFCIRPS